MWSYGTGKTSRISAIWTDTNRMCPTSNSTKMARRWLQAVWTRRLSCGISSANSLSISSAGTRMPLLIYCTTASKRMNSLRTSSFFPPQRMASSRYVCYTELWRLIALIPEIDLILVIWIRVVMGYEHFEQCVDHLVTEQWSLEHGPVSKGKGDHAWNEQRWNHIAPIPSRTWSRDQSEKVHRVHWQFQEAVFLSSPSNGTLLRPIFALPFK